MRNEAENIRKERCSHDTEKKREKERRAERHRYKRKAYLFVFGFAMKGVEYVIKQVHDVELALKTIGQQREHVASQQLTHP